VSPVAPSAPRYVDGTASEVSILSRTAVQTTHPARERAGPSSPRRNPGAPSPGDPPTAPDASPAPISTGWMEEGRVHPAPHGRVDRTRARRQRMPSRLRHLLGGQRPAVARGSRKAGRPGAPGGCQRHAAAPRGAARICERTLVPARTGRHPQGLLYVVRRAAGERDPSGATGSQSRGQPVVRTADTAGAGAETDAVRQRTRAASRARGRQEEGEASAGRGGHVGPADIRDSDSATERLHEAAGRRSRPGHSATVRTRTSLNWLAATCRRLPKRPQGPSAAGVVTNRRPRRVASPIPSGRDDGEDQQKRVAGHL